MSSPRQAAVIRKGLSEAHAEASPKGSRQANEECVPAAVCSQRSSEHWGKRRDGAIHETRQSWLHDLKHEKPPIRFILTEFDIGTQVFLLQLLGSIFVRALLLRQVIK